MAMCRWQTLTTEAARFKGQANHAHCLDRLPSMTRKSN